MEFNLDAIQTSVRGYDHKEALTNSIQSIWITDVKSRKMEEAGPVPPPKGVLHYLKSEVGGELNSPTDE